MSAIRDDCNPSPTLLSTPGGVRSRLAVPLRIVEATEAYKLQNIRYKQLDQERELAEKAVE